MTARLSPCAPLLAAALATVCLAGAVAPTTHAGFQLFHDFDQWTAASGPFTTIGFADLPSGTFVSDQYESLGAIFPDGNDYIVGDSVETYPIDGYGLAGNAGPIVVEFATPMHWVGAHSPDVFKIAL